LALPNGDIVCAWFAGTLEGVSDISIYLSRLEKGSDEWSKPVKLSDDPVRAEQNPVLFNESAGKLWLMWTAQKSGNQDTAIIRRRVSTDFGHTWSEVDVLLDTPGTFIRQPIAVLPGGEWLLPVFLCRTTPGVKWVGNNDCSAVNLSLDGGKTWTQHEVPESVGCVHMNIVSLSDGILAAFFRSRWADFIYRSESADGGRSWTKPAPMRLPNNNASIQAIMLQSGRLAIVFNNMSAAGVTARRQSLYDEIEDGNDPVPETEPSTSAPEGGRSAFWGAPRAPLTIALSDDGGQTWPVSRNIEVGDGYCLTNNSKERLNREYSYPSVIQTDDGMIHVAFTYFRQRIKYVRFPEDWVAEPGKG
jgi:predicted neuraminidase